MTVKDVVIGYLKEHKFDGLCNPEMQCGCGLDDFGPCDGAWGGMECQPAKKKIAIKEDTDDWSDFEIGDEIFVIAEEAKD